jgi:hypothetical protein
MKLESLLKSFRRLYSEEKVFDDVRIIMAEEPMSYQVELDTGWVEVPSDIGMSIIYRNLMDDCLDLCISDIKVCVALGEVEGTSVENLSAEYGFIVLHYDLDGYLVTSDFETVLVL